MHIALDLTQDLLALSQYFKEQRPLFKTLITTNFKSEEGQELENFQAIKKAFMGDEKALVIQVNEEIRQKSKCNIAILINQLRRLSTSIW